jgi:ADP-heptose:LPS heptosyltransferase
MAARDMGLRFFGKQIEDFGDAAALASLCDRVVSVDSAPAHLAASMGIDTLILLPFLADWRWGIDHRRSAWYPSARLFRQHKQRNWSAPIAELIGVLRHSP